MKRLFKGIFIACGILMIAGIGLGLAGFIMGGTFEGVSVPFYYRGISGLSANITGAASAEAEGIRRIRVDMKAGKFEIEHGNFEEIQVDADQSRTKVNVSTEGDTLVVSSKGRWGSKGGVARIYLPDNMELKSAELNIKGGSLETDRLTAQEVTVDAGGGEFVCDGLIKAEEASFEVGAGAISIALLESSESDFDCSAGRIECTMTESMADYYFSGECSLGRLSYGDQEWHVNDDIEIGSEAAKRTIDAKCSVGDITIDFDK
ncbi:DUF4097 domain-containing protein [Ruminococcus sp. OA3]|uniref:DUF4097 family beta strand repeat-containing protein n=1 Tax=Ruminococcus sp. OA3 TaxID=2914164 RepID=UPI001F05E3AB|nr:DUF4097 family beta strand repeat-containing protein [Ruminococcus sp. OA3]MCH1984299.1 DUF4097 domain-containing protein [Ruminococcus sp. OA3]